MDGLQTELAERKTEITQLTAQYKKEAQLRKKYKNELEDLKGAIRVYARVRPMAQYEIERQCEKIVSFPDETSVTVQTSRGPKDFEFDAAFTEFASQDEVFEDTKRLVESMLDGYNVCLFAYGQTGSGECTSTLSMLLRVLMSPLLCRQNLHHDGLSGHARSDASLHRRDVPLDIRAAPLHHPYNHILRRVVQ